MRMGQQKLVLFLVLLCALVPAYLLYQEIVKDGGYSQWSDWSACSKTCGQGSQNRLRVCTEPKPGRFGKPCDRLGSSQETRECLVKHCPIDGGYAAWSEYGACDKTCGVGGVQKRTRTCSNPAPEFDGKPCEGPFEEFKPCQNQPCPIDGGFTEWSAFGPCDKSCGTGLQKRSRSCSNPAPAHGGKECVGPPEETQQCNTNPCPVDGGFTEWSVAGECDKPCGPGNQNMTRTCNQPAPAFGGKECDGPTLMTQPCNIKDCESESES